MRSLSINIIAGINAAVSSVSTSGHESHILTKQEEKYLKLIRKILLKKNIAENVLVENRLKFFSIKPTTFNDISKNMWNEVQTHLIIKKCHIKLSSKTSYC